MKYFVVSDIHSFYSLLKENLKKVGFDETDMSHRLILCGDLFDRGNEPTELLEFVKSLGDRFTYVRGNHEDLLMECLNEIRNGWNISNHHKSNGTYSTIQQLMSDYYQKQGIDFYDKVKEAYQFMWNKQKELLKNHVLETDTSKIVELYKPMNDVVEWINSKSVDYCEIDNYIFVHGWIPSLPKIEDEGPSRWPTDSYTYRPDWRTANRVAWEAARWDNGMLCWKKGVKEKDKTIVCGHYHCSWGWSHIDQERKEFPSKCLKNWKESFQPYIKEGIIALDACTAYSELMNIFVFESSSTLVLHTATVDATNKNN